MNTIKQVKESIDAGKAVYWNNDGYTAYKDSIGQYLITFEPNGHTVGLTDEYDASDFYIEGLR